MSKKKKGKHRKGKGYFNIPVIEAETLDTWRNPIILSLNVRPDSRADYYEVNMEALRFLGLIKAHYFDIPDGKRYDWLVGSETSSRALGDNSESMHCFGVTECPDSMDLERVRDAVVECWPETPLGLHAKVIAPVDVEWPFYKAMVELQI